MHPAYSVILFTTASGAGYGLLVWLALFRLLGLIPPDRQLGLLGLGLALGLISVGLLSSTAHLGRPERAWRAVTQWRSSWLSREGIAALAAYVPAGLLLLGWGVLGAGGVLSGLLALVSIALALVTVWCTGMIYASLRTIPQWHQPLTPPVYVALALATGGLLYSALLRVLGHEARHAAVAALLALLAALALKLLYWRTIDRERSPHTTGTATGLGRLGKVRPLDPPHTGENFVMREMGYRVARRHAAVLRGLALVLGFAAPAVAIVVALGDAGAAGYAASMAAVACAALGVVVERWLFFAEARHIAMLYYRID